MIISTCSKEFFPKRSAINIISCHTFVCTDYSCLPLYNLSCSWENEPSNLITPKAERVPLRVLDEGWACGLFAAVCLQHSPLRLNRLGRTAPTYNSCSNLSPCSSKGLLSNFVLKEKNALYSIVKPHMSLRYMYTQTLTLISFLRELLCCCLWLTIDCASD